MSVAMVRPESTDVVGLINYIATMSEFSYAAIMDYLNRKTYTLEDVAAYLGKSKDQVSRQPWNQPNWGVPDFGTQTKRWKFSTFKAWIFDRSEDDRRKEWESMGASKRRRAIGGAA